MPAGKCALITGSTAGLGYAIAERLAASGCNIVLNGVAPANEGDAAAEKLARDHGAQAVYERADLSELAQIERLIAGASARFGGIDIVVNNAVVRHFAPIETLTPAEWEHSLAVNLTAPFHFVRLVLPGMRARELRPHLQSLVLLWRARRGSARRLRHDQDRADRTDPRDRARNRRHRHNL